MTKRITVAVFVIVLVATSAAAAARTRMQSIAFRSKSHRAVLGRWAAFAVYPDHVKLIFDRIGANNRAQVQQMIAGYTLLANIVLRGLELALRDVGQ